MPLSRIIQVYRDWRYVSLLVNLLGLLLIEPLIWDHAAARILFNVLFSVVTLTAMLSLSYERSQRRLLLGLGGICLAAAVIENFLVGPAHGVALVVSRLCGTAFFFYAVARVLADIADERRMRADSLAGAAAGYLLLGVGWGLLFVAVERFAPGSFHLAEHFADRATEAELTDLMLYYSFVTLTTLGYGDISPVTPAACTLAWVEAVTGQFYIAIVVAGLISVLVSNRNFAAGDSAPGEHTGGGDPR